MHKAARKTHCTTEEAVEFCIGSSESKDNEYDKEDEKMFRQGERPTAGSVRIYLII